MTNGVVCGPSAFFVIGGAVVIRHCRPRCGPNDSRPIYTPGRASSKGKGRADWEWVFKRREQLAKRQLPGSRSAGERITRRLMSPVSHPRIEIGQKVLSGESPWFSDSSHCTPDRVGSGDFRIPIRGVPRRITERVEAWPSAEWDHAVQLQIAPWQMPFMYPNPQVRKCDLATCKSCSVTSALVISTRSASIAASYTIGLLARDMVEPLPSM